MDDTPFRGLPEPEYEDPEAWRSEGIIPQFPGTDHDAKFHQREGDWRTPSQMTNARCDLAVHRLLSAALASALGIDNPAEFGALHGAAYDLVHDPGISEEYDAHEQLVSLVRRMARPELAR